MFVLIKLRNYWLYFKKSFLFGFRFYPDSYKIFKILLLMLDGVELRMCFLSMNRLSWNLVSPSFLDCIYFCAGYNLRRHLTILIIYQQNVRGRAPWNYFMISSYCTSSTGIIPDSRRNLAWKDQPWDKNNNPDLSELL